MSKLPNAPLKEVSAQLTWHLGKNDFSKYGFLTGDYYNVVKDHFPTREALMPDGIPFQLLIDNPTHKFKKNESNFPFVVVGPGIIGVNVDDENYFWKDLRKEIKTAFKPIFDIVPDLSNFDHIHLSLEYIDFFEIDFQKQTAFDFLNNNLNVNIQQDFIDSKKSNGVDLNFCYQDEEVGGLRISYNKGKIKGNKTGLIIRTSAISGVFDSNFEKSLLWYDIAHEKCSELFKNMTKGNLYESFC